MGPSELHTPEVQPLQFRRAPLAAAALWFALGIAAARLTAPATVEIVAALLLLALLAALALSRDRIRIAWVPVAGLWIAAGLAAAIWQPGPQTSPPLEECADGLSRTVRGTVTRVRTLETDSAANGRDTPEMGEVAEELFDPQSRPLSIDFAAESVEIVTPDTSRMRPMTGGVRVFAYPAPGARAPELRCGDLVELPVRMKLPERYRDPGAWQYADYLLSQGIDAQGSVRAERLRVVGRASPWRWSRFHCEVYAAQAWAAGRMAQFAGSRANRILPKAARLNAADASMLNAMLFGDRTGLTHTLRVGFERTGSFHLFVVSGLHVALLAGAVFYAMRRFRAPVLSATVVTLALATGYAVLTGFGQPVQRALAMTALFLMAKLLWRDASTLNALGAAALGMLVWSPSSLFDASLQMTVLAVVAIAGIASPLAEWTFLRYARAARDIFGPDHGFDPNAQQLRVMVQLWGEAFAALLGRWARELPAHCVRLVLAAAELALVGIVAELVMVLPMALFFHRAAVFAIPANMVVIPVVAVLAPLGVATFVASLASPWLAAPPGAATALLLHGVQWTVSRLSGLAVADVRVPGAPRWIALIAVTGWLCCMWLVRRGRLGAWITVALLPAIAALVLWPQPVQRTQETLEVDALDVGQGDSLLVVGPHGQTMLVDAGGPVGRSGQASVDTGSGAGFDVGEEVVSPYLWSRQFRRLDIVALTHAHADHMGGMPAVLRNFRPRELWVGIDPGSAGYAALLAEARTLGIAVRHLHAGDAVAWDGVDISVLSPDPAYRNPGPAKNDDSLVMRMDYGRASALLEGDAERRSEQTMLAAGRVAPVTLLKVGHHGSLTSTTPAFLAATAPRDAVLSSGRDNPFGHPRGEVVSRFAAAGVKLYRTDEFGLTGFLLYPDGRIAERLGVR